MCLTHNDLNFLLSSSTFPPALSSGVPFSHIVSVGFQEWALGLPSPAAQPSSMADAVSGRLGTSGGKVKAMLPLGVIEDDNGILCLAETGRDQRRHEGAAATGGNSLANATNY